MTGFVSEGTKIIDGIDQTLTKQMLPHAIDHHARGQRIVFVGNPIGELHPPTVLTVTSNARIENGQNSTWYFGTFLFQFTSHQNGEIRNAAFTNAHRKIIRWWHLAFEFYDNYANGIPNANNPIAAAAYAKGGTPFSPQYMPYNGPTPVNCHSAVVIRCKGRAIGTTGYINYQVTPLDNISFRPEYYYDDVGWRTGTRGAFVNWGIGWQHWLSPQIELRPEVDWDRSINAKAFNGNANAGIPGDKNYTVLGAFDVIIHF